MKQERECFKEIEKNRYFYDTNKESVNILLPYLNYFVAVVSLLIRLHLLHVLLRCFLCVFFLLCVIVGWMLCKRVNGGCKVCTWGKFVDWFGVLLWVEFGLVLIFLCAWYWGWIDGLFVERSYCVIHFIRFWSLSVLIGEDKHWISRYEGIEIVISRSGGIVFREIRYA